MTLDVCRTGPQPPALSAILDLHGLGYRQFYMPAIFHLTGLITLVERNFPYAPGLTGGSRATRAGSM